MLERSMLAIVDTKERTDMRSLTGVGPFTQAWGRWACLTAREDSANVAVAALESEGAA